MGFSLRSLSIALASLSTATLAQAAGLDRSTQPSWAFTQDGTFAYIENITINPKVEGTDKAGNHVNDMAKDYTFTNYGAKADVNDNVSVGVFFDEPWAADTEYKGKNIFTNQPITDAELQSKGALAQQALKKAQQAGIDYQTDPTNKDKLVAYQTAKKTATEAGASFNVAQAVAQEPNQGTKISVDSQNITGLVGVKLGEKKNFQIYGGPVLEKLSGELRLRGTAYSLLQGYDAQLYQDTAYGWMAGVAYTKPEIGLKASLSYRSEIEHNGKASEMMPATQAHSTDELSVTMPKSVNLDFQTGLNPTTLLTAKVRYVPWSDFTLKPKMYAQTTKKVTGQDGKPLYPNGLNIIDYSDDAWAVDLGLGKKINDKLSMSGTVGWDSGAGDPTSILGPVKGNWNFGLGAKYNLTPNWAVSAGVRYLMLGDAKAKLPNKMIVGDFKDNDAWVYGLRLTYQKK